MKIRKFESGASRDTNENKLEIARFLSPEVLERFCEYMNHHRTMRDGSLREPDNWKNLFGENHEQVCLDSMARHFFAYWKNCYTTKDNAQKEEELCGIIFNAMASLYAILKVDQNKR